MGSYNASTYRPSSFLEKIKYAFLKWKDVYQATDGLGKAGMIINLPLPGLGSALLGRLEKGLLAFLAYFAVIFLGVYVAIQKANGVALNEGSLAILYIVLFLAVVFMIASAFGASITKGAERIDDHKWHVESVFVRKNKAKSGFAAYVEDFRTTYRNTSKKHKVLLVLSFFVMGIPEFFFSQILKGLVFFGAQIGVFVYLIVKGAADIGILFALNVISSPNGALVNGLVALTLIAALIVAYVFHLKDILALVKATDEGKRQTFRGEMLSYINEKFPTSALMIPIIGAVAFTVLPILFMILTAFTNYSMKTVPGYENYNPLFQIPLKWTGFEAFGRLFADHSSLIDMVNVFGWTMVWATLATFSCYFGGMLLAMLLNKKAVKGKVIYRSIFVVAMALPQFVSLLVVRSMFDTHGIVNNILMELGVITSRIDFWQIGDVAKVLILLINMWVGIPYYMLLMSGLLLNIPKDLYEAADIEGASRWQKFKSITFPQIFYMTTPVLITSFVSNINNFNVIWFLTGGGTVSTISGTAGDTDILITWLYKMTFQAGGQPDYNLAAVVGIIMFIISATFSLVIFRRSKAYTAEEEFQ